MFRQQTNFPSPFVTLQEAESCRGLCKAKQTIRGGSTIGATTCTGHAVDPRCVGGTQQLPARDTLSIPAVSVVHNSYLHGTRCRSPLCRWYTTATCTRHAVDPRCVGGTQQLPARDTLSIPAVSVVHNSYTCKPHFIPTVRKNPNDLQYTCAALENSFE
ncbi:hypothetical protein ACOMHN_002539 [Nucella lapillus]